MGTCVCDVCMLRKAFRTSISHDALGRERIIKHVYVHIYKHMHAHRGPFLS